MSNSAPLYKRILVPTDFSEGSGLALRWAGELARAYGARIDIVHVLALHGSDPVEAELQLPKCVPDELADLVDERTLERALSEELGILHACREHDHDLIVMGTHGRTGLRHVFLGSTAERVVQLSPVPVLTVRQPGHTFEHP